MHQGQLTVPSLSPRLLATLEEIGELKRIRSAGRLGSIATRCFEQDWRALVGGTSTADAMRAGVARALVATRLGDIDGNLLHEFGLSGAETETVLVAGFDAVAEPVAPALRDRLRASVGPAAYAADSAATLSFVSLLAAQPRAGVTCPGLPRVMLEPPESHAEHCAVVAVYGVLLAPAFGADPEPVWLAAMAHHLHNAFIPDSGFTGEMLLGEHLAPVFARATERALAEMPATLADRVRDARRILPDADSPEGQAFHAADTLDRVWQIRQHLRPGTVTMASVLGDMALVHDGPTKRFQDALLRVVGLVA